MSLKENVINKKLREESGSVNYPASDWLTGLLYDLMRDSVPPGQMERVVRDLELSYKNSEEVLYSNGWLAKYADCLSKRILKKVEK